MQTGILALSTAQGTVWALGVATRSLDGLQPVLHPSHLTRTGQQLFLLVLTHLYPSDTLLVPSSPSSPRSSPGASSPRSLLGKSMGEFSSLSTGMKQTPAWGRGLGQVCWMGTML